MESTISQTRGEGWGTTQKIFTDDLLFHFFPSFAPPPHGPKIIRLNKTHISTSKSSLSEANFSSICRNTLEDILLYNRADSSVWFTIISNNMSSNTCHHMVVPVFLFLYIDKHNVKLGRGKMERQQLRHFKHKWKHKIGCYPKSLLILTAYQVHGWWTMILIPVKYQPDGSNVREIIFKISWHEHIKHSKPYTFILQKVNKPPDGFCTHLFFAS